MPPFLVRLLGGDKLILASLQSNSFGVIFLLSHALLGVQLDDADEDDAMVAVAIYYTVLPIGFPTLAPSNAFVFCG